MFLETRLLKYFKERRLKFQHTLKQGKEIEIPTHTKEETILLAQDFKLPVLQGDNAEPHEKTLDTGAGDNS